MINSFSLTHGFLETPDFFETYESLNNGNCYCTVLNMKPQNELKVTFLFTFFRSPRAHYTSIRLMKPFHLGGLTQLEAVKNWTRKKSFWNKPA